VAPVLLDAAFDTSPRDLARYRLALFALALVAVLLTTAVVAVVGVAMAGLPLAAAIALGAIVAPPDAAAASAVLNQFRPPHRIMAILQGESLLNDATALLIYRMAVLAAAGPLPASSVAPMIVVSGLGSIAAGYVLARLFLIVLRQVDDAASGTIMQFVGTFGIWILAEQIGLSAIVTIVVYGITIARSAPRETTPRNRVSSYSVWETVVFVLNVLAFVLMGLQAGPILERLSGDGLGAALLFAVVVLVTVILVRLVWVLGCGAVIREYTRRKRGGPDAEGLGLRDDLLIGWCGVRGLVTLATGFALPADFPGRDPIVLAAFSVVLGTLVLQGLTLKPMLRLLRLGSDRSIEEEVSQARVAIMQAALDTLDGATSSAATAVREQYAAAQRIAEHADDAQAATELDMLRLKAIKYQRKTLERLRQEGTIGDEAYHRLEEELDWAELDASPAGRFQPLTT
jgi:CPA1 family monovalent cation:H+ antiporter